MKHITVIFLLCCTTTLFADDYRNRHVLDTLKNPEIKKLTRKERRQAARAAARSESRKLSGERKKADDLYENLGFMEAADYYENLESTQQSTYVQTKLANSYRLNAQYEESEYWYAQMINETSNPDDFINYALVLQSNGKCEDAVRWYGEYLKVTMDDNRDFITDCDQLEVFKESKNVAVSNVEALNSGALDFSPIQYKDGVIFTSNRGTKNGISVNRDKWTQGSFTDIFYAKKNSDGEITKIEAMDDEVNGKYHDGVTTFNKPGTLMIFSRSNKKGRNEEGIKDLKLYSSEYKNDYWTEAVELNINNKEFASAHPTLSADGRRLYFASDRPGGYGGMDIWMSEKLGSKWQEPKNLGPTVNTSGQEIFPFISDQETLYYASNGHRGLGGLDIFAVNKTDESDETTWSVRENLGVPFNTEKDDFGFTMNNDGESGYFSSNRTGGKGGDDIYEWKGSLNEKIAQNTRRKICVNDAATGERLPGVDVTIVETTEQGKVLNSQSNDIFLKLKPLNADNKEFVLTMVSDNNETVDGRAMYETDSKGSFLYKVEPNRNYVLLVENPKFENYREKISGAQLFAEEEHCLAVTKKTCLLLDGKVVNETYNRRIPNAKIILFNKCTGETTEEVSDDNGEFNFCLECGCEYEVIGRKNNFGEGRADVTTIIPDCAEKVSTGADVPLNAVVKMNVAGSYTDVVEPKRTPIGIPQPYGATPNSPTYIFATPNMLNGTEPFPTTGMTTEELNRYFTGKSTPDYTEGQIIKLSNIYYDFDKAYIRKDASRELDYVYQLLTTYPSMHISLISHTDARGRSSYNERLSRRRAESAMMYLVNLGISPKRLIYEGFGESKHVNDCEDGVNCDEMQHQMNRRTEIKITRFNAPANVRVER